MTRLADRGLAVEVPPGWEGRIFLPQLPPPAQNHPVLHLADFTLPFARSSYGAETGATMPSDRGGIICSLVEFGSDLVDVGLYAPQGVPKVHARDLDPRALQIPRPNQGGVQRFFSVRGRAFSLYVIASIDRRTAARLHDANTALASLDVAAKGRAP